MSLDKNKRVKARLHPRNKNRERYDLDALIAAHPELKKYVTTNKYGAETVDFADPNAVKLLNKALLSHYYGIQHWQFPDENLCPPIPGRADYVHYMADLLSEGNFGKIPTGDSITCLDVGVGASCIYPIIGVTEYGWNFIGSDIDPKSMASAQRIIDTNASLQGKIECRLQAKPKNIFDGIVNENDIIDIVVCNPPFHASMEDAQKGTKRKIKNLSGKKLKALQLNFAGIGNELVCDGGEYQFILNMIEESKTYAKTCLWFSTLVSKQSNLKRIYSIFDGIDTAQIKEILMGTGNKSSRIVAWTFLSKDAQKEWRETRWKTLA